MDYIHRINTDFINNKLLPQLINNIVASKHVNDYVKKMFSFHPHESHVIRLSDLKRGIAVEDVFDAVTVNSLGDINEYDAKMLNLLASNGYDKDAMIRFLVANNLNDIRNGCCKDMAQDLKHQIIELKKSSALHRIECDFQQKSRYNI